MTKINKLLAKISEFEERQEKVISFDFESKRCSWLDVFKGFPETVECIEAVKSIDDLRFLIRHHLWFLLVIICRKRHLLNKWADERCRECCRDPNDKLQLWAREHFKSTIWTFGRVIQDILSSHGNKESFEQLNPDLINALAKWQRVRQDATTEGNYIRLHWYIFEDECSIGIFSATRTLAQAFLKEIMMEFQENQTLKELFPDILYDNPAKFAPTWGISTGITVKRKGNRKEATVEAWGLLKGQPTSKHFTICVFDDVVTREVAVSLVQNATLIEEWSNAFSLGSENGAYRAIGTRKHYNDPYSVMIERESFKEVRYTPYDENGNPVLMSKEALENRRRNSGEITFASEYLQEPLKDSALGFDIRNVQYHTITNTDGLALYAFSDPATAQKKDSDYTVILIVGIDPSNGIILIDGIRDRLRPSQKWDELYGLYTKYPKIKQIYWEKVALCTDIDYFREKACEINHPSFGNLFRALIPRVKKADRIMRLEPVLNEKKLFLPKQLMKRRVDGGHYNLVDSFIREELSKFPFAKHDDILDTLAYVAIKLECDEISGIIGKSAKKVVNPIITQQKGMNFANF